MECPFCRSANLSVVDSRSELLSIKRRRECHDCSERFTTYERIEQLLPMVVKKSGAKEVFDCDKIRTGITRACVKRPVSDAKVEDLVESIYRSFIQSHRKEVTSSEVGESILRGLREVDEIAFIRFASVYREFSDVKHFIELLTSLDP